MQSMVQRFTSAFEETKQELQSMTDDLDRRVNFTLAGKLNAADLPGKLQDANLVNRSTMAAHLKQVSPVKSATPSAPILIEPSSVEA